jgi:hypothetical protein
MIKLIFLAALVLGILGLRAEDIKPIQLSLVPDIALHSRTNSIHGFALNLWGENPQHAFNLGVINGSTGQSAGLSLAISVNYAESYSGVMLSLVNVSVGKFTGWQAGLVNSSEGSFAGLQTGAINSAENFHGLQLGLFNYCDHLRGVQIGLISIAENNPWFERLPRKFAPAFPLVNWSF